MTSPYDFTAMSNGDILYAAHINELQAAVEEHPMLVRPRTDHVYSAATCFGLFRTYAAMTADRLCFQPIWIPEAGLAVKIVQVNVSTLSAGATRLGIYDCDQTTGLPSDLIDDWGTIDCSTTGSKQINITDTTYQRTGDDFPFLWLASVSNATASYYAIGAEGAANPVSGHGSTLQSSCLSRTFTYGALPDPAGSLTLQYLAQPIIGLILA